MSRCEDCRIISDEVEWRISEDYLCIACDKKRKEIVAQRYKQPSTKKGSANNGILSSISRSISNSITRVKETLIQKSLSRTTSFELFFHSPTQQRLSFSPIVRDQENNSSYNFQQDNVETSPSILDSQIDTIPAAYSG